MNMFVRLISDYLSVQVAEKIGDHVKEGVSSILVPLKKLALGFLILLFSLPLWFTGFIFLLMAMFFSISETHAYIPSSLWTSGISFLLALLITVLGLGIMRRSAR
jgi:hypothetical protein